MYSFFVVLLKAVNFLLLSKLAAFRLSNQAYFDFFQLLSAFQILSSIPSGLASTATLTFFVRSRVRLGLGTIYFLPIVAVAVIGGALISFYIIANPNQYVSHQPFLVLLGEAALFPVAVLSQILFLANYSALNASLSFSTLLFLSVFTSTWTAVLTTVFLSDSTFLLFIILYSVVPSLVCFKLSPLESPMRKAAKLLQIYLKKASHILSFNSNKKRYSVWSSLVLGSICTSFLFPASVLYIKQLALGTAGPKCAAMLQSYFRLSDGYMFFFTSFISLFLFPKYTHGTLRIRQLLLYLVVVASGLILVASNSNAFLSLITSSSFPIDSRYFQLLVAADFLRILAFLFSMALISRHIYSIPVIADATFLITIPLSSYVLYRVLPINSNGLTVGCAAIGLSVSQYFFVVFTSFALLIGMAWQFRSRLLRLSQ